MWALLLHANVVVDATIAAANVEPHLSEMCISVVWHLLNLPLRLAGKHGEYERVCLILHNPICMPKSTLTEPHTHAQRDKHRHTHIYRNAHTARQPARQAAFAIVSYGTAGLEIVMRHLALENWTMNNYALLLLRAHVCVRVDVSVCLLLACWLLLCSRIRQRSLPRAVTLTIAIVLPTFGEQTI